jgi:hypothetical protein
MLRRMGKGQAPERRERSAAAMWGLLGVAVALFLYLAPAAGWHLPKVLAGVLAAFAGVAALVALFLLLDFYVPGFFRWARLGRRKQVVGKAVVWLSGPIVAATGVHGDVTVRYHPWWRRFRRKRGGPSPISATISSTVQT